MKILNHPAVIALSVATLCLLLYVRPLDSLDHLAIYHFDGPAIVLYAPMVLNLCALWLLLTGLFWLAQRPGWPRTIIWLGLITFLPLILLRTFCAVKGCSLPHVFSLALLIFSLIVFAVLLLLWRPSFESPFETARGFVATILAFAALSGGLILIQLLWFAWRARNLNTPVPLHHRDSASLIHPPEPRVIWIVLDELSYQQLYEKRFPQLQLPDFDQVASQATVFAHVIPTGIFTEDVVPSLMTGIHIDQVRSSADGQLFIHDSTSNDWERFNQHDTIFQDALNDGYSTAIAGWFNPYCRIMPQVLDHCFWTFHKSDDTFTSQSFKANLLDPIRDLIQKVRSFVFLKSAPAVNTVLDNQLHTMDYHNLFRAADSQLADRSANFIFLHMPVPHQGGIYNRKTSAFVTSQSSYIDNLALADRYLAHVHQVLQQQGTWDSSVILIMGDHSWRTQLVWRNSPFWTPEDETASSSGQFDDRPAYIVKMPQQQQGTVIDTPLPAIRTRALLDAIISHKIQTADDLAAWAKLK
jgi:hypothetical protein